MGTYGTHKNPAISHMDQSNTMTNSFRITGDTMFNFESQREGVPDQKIEKAIHGTRLPMIQKLKKSEDSDKGLSTPNHKMHPNPSHSNQVVLLSSTKKRK